MTTDLPEQTTSSSSTSTNSGYSDCNVPITLGNYCLGFLNAEDNGQVLSFFNITTDVDEILRMIINGDTVRALGSECESGVWCLPDSYHEQIYQGMSDFYKSPICNQALWDCLESIAEFRQTCDDIENLFALLEVLSLLCDMNALGDLQPECYTRTVEILNLLYSDEVKGEFVDFNGPLCADYNKKIVKSFLCTVDACGLKQTVFLKEFGALADIALNSEMIFVKCELDNLCPDNTTLAPRLDYSANFTSQNATDLPAQPSAPAGTKSDDEILKEELEEQTELDRVFDELEKQLEEEENTKGKKGETNTSDKDKDLPSTDIEMPVTDTGTFGDASWFEGTTVGKVDGDGQDTLSVSNFSMGGDATLLFGTITLSALALIGLMVIVFLGLRHYRRTRSAAYKKGYSQLSEEESRMLTYE